MEDLFAATLPPTRQSTGQSSLSLDSDSDTALQSDEDDLPSQMLSSGFMAAHLINSFLGEPTVRYPTQQRTNFVAVEPGVASPSSPPDKPAPNPGPSGNTQEAMITAGMPLSEVLMQLSSHGCNDVTQQLDKSKCSEYPERIGGFGEVYRGVLRDGRKVSIKILKIVGSTGDERKLIKHAAHELYVWSKCKHPNVLELIGMAQFRNQITMISPWMENGNLQSFLPRQPQLDRCKLCVQIADSIAYLHGQGVVHGDIKGANILLSRDYTPKLADFGNAWLEGTLRFAPTTGMGSMSIRWAAPEIAAGEIKLSFEADVYALGMTILEVITGLPPYESLIEVAAIVQIVTKKHPARPEAFIPSGVMQADLLWSLLTSCWDPKPEDRPNARQVREVMKGITPEGLKRNLDCNNLIML